MTNQQRGNSTEQIHKARVKQNSIMQKYMQKSIKSWFQEKQIKLKHYSGILDRILQ